MPSQVNNTRLNSWKEIANYLERDLSTVMRWEKEKDLPVHRVPGGKRQTVFAYTTEIDSWLSGNGENGNALAEVAKIGVVAGDGTGASSMGVACSTGREAIVKPSARWVAPTRRASLALLSVSMAFGGLAYWRARTSTGLHAQPSDMVVVLPFRNLRPDPDSDFLGLALADVGRGQLSYTSQIAVHPSIPTRSFGGFDPTLERVSQGMQRQVSVMGSYVKEGQNVRFFLELIAEPGHVTLWHNTLLGSMDSLTTLQDSMAEQIGTALHVQVRRLASQPVTNGKHPPNPVASEYFLRGVNALERSDLRGAIQWQEKAVRANPDFGPALAYLAFVYASFCYQQSSLLVPPTEAESNYLDKSVTLYHQAIDKNDASPSVLSLGGLYLMELGRLDESVVLLRHAVQTNPNYAQGHLWLSQAYRYGGMLQESLSEAELASRLDPEVREYTTLNTYIYAGEYDKFLQSLSRGLGARVLFYSGLAHYYERDLSAAERDFRKAYEMQPAHPHAQYAQAFLQALAGQNDEGIRQLRVFEQKYQADGEMIYKTAQAYAILGDKRSAIRLLRQSIERDFYCYPYFLRDVLLQSVREDPEYVGVMELARARHEAFRRRFF